MTFGFGVLLAFRSSDVADSSIIDLSKGDVARRVSIDYHDRVRWLERDVLPWKMMNNQVQRKTITIEVLLIWTMFFSSSIQRVGVLIILISSTTVDLPIHDCSPWHLTLYTVDVDLILYVWLLVRRFSRLTVLDLDKQGGRIHEIDGWCDHAGWASIYKHTFHLLCLPFLPPKFPDAGCRHTVLQDLM